MYEFQFQTRASEGKTTSCEFEPSQAFKSRINIEFKNTVREFYGLRYQHSGYFCKVCPVITEKVAGRRYCKKKLELRDSSFTDISDLIDSYYLLVRQFFMCAYCNMVSAGLKLKSQAS